MEDAFDYASPVYVKAATKAIDAFDPAVDYPEMFDGNTGAPFFLDTDSDHSADWFQTAEAAPSVENSTLGKNLSGYTHARVTVTDWSKIEDRTTETAELNDASTLAEAYGLMNPSQEVTDVAAMCLFSHVIDYLGDNGELIGRVGLCQLPELRDNHPAVFVKLDEAGNTLSRQGIIIPNARALGELVGK